MNSSHLEIPEIRSTDLPEAAVKLATKIIKLSEGCNLIAYPDPASDLYKALSRHGMLQKYMSGKIKHKDLPENFLALDGSPFTIGYGQTNGVKHGDVWTLEQATNDLNEQVRVRMAAVLKAAPKLSKASIEQIAACVSLQYNIGAARFASSTVVKCIAADDIVGAGKAFLLFNKAKGKIDAGLVNRRKAESDLFLSVRG